MCPCCSVHSKLGQQSPSNLHGDHSVRLISALEQVSAAFGTIPANFVMMHPPSLMAVLGTKVPQPREKTSSFSSFRLPVTSYQHAALARNRLDLQGHCT